jgi:hypothetical protein
MRCLVIFSSYLTLISCWNLSNRFGFYRVAFELLAICKVKEIKEIKGVKPQNAD